MKITRVSVLLLTASATLLAFGGLNRLYPKARFAVISQDTATVNLVADGGSPVPPVPPGPALAKGITAARPVLSADGGSPVPPVPHRWLDGGSSVPPVPTGFAG